MNTRNDNNGKALKAWKKLGVGHIAKPLRYIADRTNSRDLKGNIILSPQYSRAAASARIGDGRTVQLIALSI